MVRDITKLIFHDDLTGLLNRRFLGHYLKNEVDWDLGEPLSLVMIDLDGFKGVNDTLGHLEGDRLLKRTAELIEESLPEQGAYGVRYAGDEFILVLEGHDRPAAREVAEDFRARVEEADLGGGEDDEKVRVTVSLGVAAHPVDASSPQALVETADAALYHSKDAGKNVVSTPADVQRAEPRPRIPCPVLVGREDVWQTCREALDEAAEGAPARMILVEGGRGTGKSRLLAELVKMADAAGTECLLERAVAVNRRIPYSSIAPLLDHYFARVEDEIELEAVDPSDLDEVSRVISTLAERVEGVEATGSSLDRRRRLFGGFVSILEAVASRQPLLVLLDDIQNVDEGTLEVFRAVLEKRIPRIVIVATQRARPAEVDPASPLGSFLGAASPFLERMRLDALEAPEVSEMVSAILPEREEAAAFDDALIVASEGNPLLVEAGVGHLIQDEAIRHDGEAWRLPEIEPEELPRSIEGLVELELETVDGELRELLHRAAVIGPNFSLQVLANVADRDEAETLEIVERARDLHIFGETETLDEEEVTFVSECFRELIYDQMATDDRTEVHRRVGEAHEDLFDDALDDVVGELAFHFDRADDPRAEAYDERLAEVRARRFREDEVEEYYRSAFEVDIPEFGEDLSPSRRERVLEVVRTFGVAAKNARLYPPGSRPLREAIDAAAEAVEAALEGAEGFTLGETGGILSLNGRVFDQPAPGSEDLVKVLRDQYVKSITFLEEARPSDVEGTIFCLAEAPKEKAPSMRYWAGRLREREVENVGLMPRVYVSDDGDGGGEGSGRRDATLTDERRESARLALRRLVSAVDATRLYPEGSSAVQDAMSFLRTDLHAALVDLSSVTWALGEGGDILVNGVPVGLRSTGSAAESIRKLFSGRDIASITIEEAIEDDEIERLVGLLGRTGPGGDETPESWADALDEADVDHARIGARRYRVAEGRRADEPEEEDEEDAETLEEETEEAEEDETSAVARARALLERDVSDVVEEGESVAELFEELLLQGEGTLARRLLDHVMGAYPGEYPAVRKAAARILDRVVGGRDPASARVAARHLASRVAEALREEEQIDPFAGLGEVAGEMARHLLDDREAPAACQLIHALGAWPEDRDDLATAARKILRSLARDASVDTFVRDISAEEPHDRDTSERVLAGLGEGARPVLTGVVRSRAPLRARRFAASVLGREGAGEDLAREVGPDAETQRCIRILEVIDDLVDDPLEAIGRAFAHADRSVREEAGRVLARCEPRRARDLLADLIEHGTGEAVLGALDAVGDSPDARVLYGRVAERILRESDVEVLEACCRTLGRSGVDEAVEPLVTVLGGRPGFFRSGYPAEARLAAARALAHIQTPGSDEALATAARKDPDEKVRQATKMTVELREASR